MQWVMPFSLFVLGLVLGAMSVSAYHTYDWGRTRYIQSDGERVIFSSDRVWESRHSPQFIEVHRAYIWNSGYPQYVHNRRSGKVFYVSDGYPSFWQPMMYEPFPRCSLLSMVC